MNRFLKTMRILLKWNWRKLSHRAKKSTLWSPLWANKWKIVLAVFLSAALTGKGTYLVKSRRPTMTMTLKYANASKGLNPNGTRFNMFEICSDKVLARAVELGGLDIDADYLASRIDVYAKISHNASKKVLSAVASGEKRTYIADEYSISYSQKNKLTSNRTNDVLYAVAMAYKEFFKANYSEKNNLLSDPLPDLDGYEYVEIERIFRDRTVALERYFQARSEENTDFVSKTGLSYQDLYTTMQNFRTIHLEKYRGYVQKYGLAKNPGEYTKKLDYANKMLAVDRSKYENAHNFRTRAVSLYDPLITGVMLVPSVDAANEFYMNRTKTGIDYLTEDAYAAAQKANGVQSEIDQNAAVVTNIKENGLSGAQYDNVKKTADKMVAELGEKLTELCKTAKKADDEYLEYKSNDYLTFRFPETGLLGYINKKLLVLVGGCVLVLSCAYFHLKAYLNRILHRQEQATAADEIKEARI